MQPQTPRLSGFLTCSVLAALAMIAEATVTTGPATAATTTAGRAANLVASVATTDRIAKGVPDQHPERSAGHPRESADSGRSTR